MDTSQIPRQRGGLSRPALRARDGFGHRLLIALVAVTLLGVVALAGGFFVQLQRGDTQEQQISSQGDAIRSLASSATDLSNQIRSLGAVPVVTPAEIAGPAGQAGQAGATGATGPAGQDGADSTVPGPAGTPGATGPAGADSTVPGPAGPAGPAGQDGRDGTNGADGAPGAPGAPGAAGRPPAGFSFVDGLGQTQNCTRDAGSPDDAATYTCTASATPAPASMRLFFPT